MDVTQSCGKYEFHREMFFVQRGTSAAAVEEEVTAFLLSDAPRCKLAKPFGCMSGSIISEVCPLGIECNYCTGVCGASVR
jgi:hypothetical protein